MELKVKVPELREALAKVSKGVGNNNLLVITSLLNIKVRDNVFYITSTDGSNYFTTKLQDKVDCDNFEVSVNADIFVKLIQKLTSADVVLSLSDDNSVLNIKGNGKYSIALLLDEDGNTIEFPQKYNIEEAKHYTSIKLSTVKNIISRNKSALASSIESPALTM